MKEIVVDYEKIRKELGAVEDKPRNRLWTLEEDKILKEFYGRKPTNAIAEKLNRTRNAVVFHAQALGLHA